MVTIDGASLLVSPFADGLSPRQIALDRRGMASKCFFSDFRRLLVILVLYPVEANHSIRRLF